MMTVNLRRSLARMQHAGRLAALAGLGLAAAGLVLLAGTAGSDSSIAVTEGDFTLSCSTNTVAEGGTLTCTLANTSAEAKPWPVVAIMHLSTDEDRALVRGSPVDVAFGARSPSAELDNGAWWIGETLVGYSRFDWPGEAGADPSHTTTTASTPTHTRTVSIVANQDDLVEGSEAFYVALGPDGSRGVGLLYNNRQRATITEDDAASSDNSLSSLKATAGRDRILSPTRASQTVAVGYEVTEATLTAEAARGATMAMSASFGGDPVDLDGRGGTSLAVLDGEESAAVPLGVGTTAVTLAVTAEDGTAATRRIDIVRQKLGAATAVTVSTGGFTLTCPAQVARAAVATCTLANTRSAPAPWPVVAVIHSSADDLRALVSEDPIIPDTDPAYVKDLSLGRQQPARQDFNYGYGELFSGGSRSVYRTYGYEKFDWSGNAPAGASRPVAIDLHHGDPGAGMQVFYVAVAPSGYTGLSKLVDNKVPVLLEEGIAPPGHPTGLRATAAAGSPAVVVDWDDVPGATSYAVRWRLEAWGAPLDFDGPVVVRSSEASITVAGAGEWVVEVAACNDAGCSRGVTDRILVELPPAPVRPGTGPVEPAGLRVATEAGSLEAEVAWDGVPGAEFYAVRWREGVRGTALSDPVLVDSPHAAVEVDHYGEWVVKVQACNAHGCGRGVPVRFRVEPVPDPPARPQNLVVEVTAGELDLAVSWDGAERASSYKVRWRRPGADFGDNEIDTTDTSATITVPDQGQWVIRVEGCNLAGCGRGAAQTVLIRRSGT